MLAKTLTLKIEDGIMEFESLIDLLMFVKFHILNHFVSQYHWFQFHFLIVFSIFKTEYCNNYPPTRRGEIKFNWDASAEMFENPAPGWLVV